MFRATSALNIPVGYIDYRLRCGISCYYKNRALISLPLAVMNVCSRASITAHAGRAFPWVTGKYKRTSHAALLFRSATSHEAYK